MPCRKVKVKLPALLTSASDEGECLASGAGLLSPRNPLKGGCLGLGVTESTLWVGAVAVFLVPYRKIGGKDYSNTVENTQF
jgi:hypothetical protein